MRGSLTALLVLTAVAASTGTAVADVPVQLDPCRAFSTSRFDVEVRSARTTGCPRVRRVVGVWRERCVTAAGRALPCRAAGFRCTPADGALLSRIAGAACRRKQSEVDMVIRRTCEGRLRIHGHIVSVAAITTDCGTAKRVGRAWVARKGCRGCRIDGWICQALPESTTTRCLRARHPRRALEIDEHIQGAAVISSALGGGRYEGRVEAPCLRNCFVLLVTADDGRSFTAQSIVMAPCEPDGTFGGYSREAPRGTPVHSDGSFRWQNPLQVVEGRFSADGRTVSGTSRFLGVAATDCSPEPLPFSARLARRVKPSGACDTLSDRRLEVEVFARRTGCTTTTRVVDAWRVDHRCVTASLDLRPCRVAGRRCTLVDGGRLRNLAGVACRAGRSLIELVIHESCSWMNPSFVLHAVSMSCATAAPLASRWASRRACSRRACTVARWSCRQLPHARLPKVWRCRRAHRAFEISQSTSLVGGGPDG